MSVVSIEDRISSVALKGAGWNMGAYVSSSPLHCHAFYLNDYRTGEIALLTIGQDVFAEVAGAKNPQRTSAAVAELMRLYSKRREDAKYLSSLGFAVTEYIKGTRTFEMWKEKSSPGARGHFCLNFYGAGKKTSVRPFALAADERTPVIDALEFVQKSRQVKNMDAAQHPEWFR